MADRTMSGIILLVCLIPAILGDQAAASIDARATIPDESYFVGQEIPLFIQVKAGNQEVTVPTPTIQGAEVYPVEEGEGDSQTGSDREFRFRVMAKEPGRLIIPSLRVDSRGQVARTSPIVLAIRSLPVAGRGAAFLGGVGALQIEAGADPSTLRLGETLEYRLHLRGPGALGSTSRPRFSGIDEGLVRIEALPTQTDFGATSPVRTFRWRLRPSQAGTLVVPPKRVASYDPSSGSYQTRASTSITIQVEDVPELDPATIEFGPEPRNDDRGLSLLVWLLAIGVAVAVAVALLSYASARWWLRHPRRTLRAIAIQLAKGLSAQSGRADPLEAARRVAESLAEYLEASRERPPGALTPDEARDGFAIATSDAELAKQAGRLIERSDWIRFGTPPNEDIANAETEELLQDAANLFTKLARRPWQYADR